jgi:hypothetical protein
MTASKGYLVAEDSGWQVPAYAQDMLWVQVGHHAGRASGLRGAFDLDVTGDADGPIRLLWGTAEGPPLANWHFSGADTPFVAGWQGTVAVGGFVERLHALERRGLEVVVVEVEGTTLPLDYARLPTLDQMQRAPFRRRNERESGSAREFTYTFLALADSIYAEYLHHAMVSELAVDCIGILGPQEGRWHEIVGMPLLVEAVTLLAPGYR